MGLSQLIITSQSLHWADGLVVAASIVLMFIIAWWAGREEKDTGDFFLGRRQVPAWVACLSFLATEVSAMTIVGVPARAFEQDWRYLQFFLGYCGAKIFVALVFLPAFYRHQCTSIYQFLGVRFGPASQYAGSAFFFIMRLLASGVRLYVASMGIAVILGWPLWAAILVFSIASTAFIAFGGIKAVVWNGAYQAAVFYLAGTCLVGYLGWSLWGQLGAGLDLAWNAGRLKVFDFALNLSDPLTFWGGFSYSFLLGMAAFGADQELVQRLLTVRTRRDSQRALAGSMLAALPMNLLYLAAGTLLFVFYRLADGASAPAQTDQIVSHFTVHYLPAGLKGLVLATIILASIDSPLVSLSASFVSDIYRTVLRPRASEEHYLAVSRAGVVVFGLILGGIAWASQSVTQALWFAFEITSITGGAILGVFLLGLLTRRRANRANVLAMVLSSLSVLTLMLLSRKGLFYADRSVITLGWTWLIFIGTAVSFAVGYVLGPLLDPPGKDAPNAP